MGKNRTYCKKYLWSYLISLLTKKLEINLKNLEDDGFGEYPICMAKTQYSFSTDPLLMGAPWS